MTTAPKGEGLQNPFRKEFVDALKDRRVIAVCAVMVVVASRFGLMSFMPLYLVRELGVETSQAGILFTVMLSGTVIGPFLWGVLSDKVQRKFVVMLVMGSSGLLVYFLPYVSEAVWLVVELFLIGLMFQAVGAILQAALADVTDPSVRSTVYGFFFTAGFGVGAFAPTIFGVITDIFSFNAAFIYIAVVSFIAILPSLYIAERKIRPGI